MINDAIRSVASVDRTIHEPTRLLLVAYLANLRTADFLFLQQELGLTQGNLSQHLTKLEVAGYVKVKKSIIGKKTRTTYQLTGAGKRAFHDYRQGLKQFLAQTEGPVSG